MKFQEFPFSQNILAGVEKAGYQECLPVQETAFKETLNGCDIFVKSQTGSGKTATFLLSVFHLMETKRNENYPLAMIVAPTRELADQIYKEALLLGSALPFKIGCFYGGVGYEQQEKQLKAGVDVIIGTPGRLIDFGKSHQINFGKVGFFVIDEADRLLDMGFFPDIRQMVRMMPRATNRFTMLFSATLGFAEQDLARDYMNNPQMIEMPAEHATVETITQELYHVGSHEKINLLLGLMKKIQPKNALIFTNTKHMAEEVAWRLTENGWPTEFIMGDLSQQKRLSLINRIKEGKISYLVATDVASRGIHIDNLELVVNYDLPNQAENYVHRVGRTARVGHQGLAISLACEFFVEYLEEIEKYIKMKIPVMFADDDLYLPDVTAGKHKPLNKREVPPRGSDRHGDHRSGKSAGRSGRNDQRHTNHKPTSAAPKTKEPPMAQPEGAPENSTSTTPESTPRKNNRRRFHRGHKVNHDSVQPSTGTDSLS